MLPYNDVTLQSISTACRPFTLRQISTLPASAPQVAPPFSTTGLSAIIPCPDFVGSSRHFDLAACGLARDTRMYVK